MLKCLFFRNKNGHKSNRRPPRSSSCSTQDQEAPSSRTVPDSIEVEPAASSSPNLINIPSQRQSNLRVFTFVELKIATRNFSRGLTLGVGGFGSVYKGFLNSTEDPEAKTEVAVKRLTKKGLQVLATLTRSGFDDEKEPIASLEVDVEMPSSQLDDI